MVKQVSWRERMGVEPTGDILCPPTDLKSAKPTGTQPLPFRMNNIIVAHDLATVKRRNLLLNIA
jgi:hypothetical protein